MGYNTKNLKKDAGGLITPQAFNTGADDYETLNSTSGSLHTKVTDPLPAGTNVIGSVQLSGSNVKDFTLHDGITAASGGSQFTIGGYKTLTVEIWGTATSRTVVFEATGVGSGLFYPISGVKIHDLTTATQTTGIYEIWQFDVTGLEKFRCNVTGVSGGNISAKGRAVA